MKLEIINPEDLTLADAIKQQYSLYYIRENHLGVATFSLIPFDKEGLALPKDEFLLVKLTSTKEQLVEDIHEVIPESEPKIALPAPVPKVYTPRQRRTYKFDGWDPTKTIEVESRPDGSIRVNFKDKDSAQEYLEYIREFFYERTLGEKFLPVATIYDELKQVNFTYESCEGWKWPTLDSGTCRYISDCVAKTKNKHMWGFTLQAPQYYPEV